MPISKLVRARSLAGTAAWLFVALVFLGCRSSSVARLDPVPRAASDALAEARRRQRLGLEGVEAAARRALELAPGWVAPERVIDDEASRVLATPERVVAHRERTLAAPDDGAAHYLFGRLVDAGLTEHFERAVERSPRLAWGYHGLAARAMQAGDAEAAIRLGRHALRRARDANERGEFARALVRYLRAAGRGPEVIDWLRDLLFGEPDEGADDRDLELYAEDRLRLRCELALSELGSNAGAERERGFRRALALIRDEGLDDFVLSILSTNARLAARSSARRIELQLALAAQPGDLREQLEAQLIAGREFELRSALLDGDEEALELENGPTAFSLPTLRHAGPRRAILDWWRALPRVVLAPDGLPARVQLRRIVEWARAEEASEGEARIERLRELGAALIDAGWYRAARTLVESLPAEEARALLSVYREAGARHAWISALVEWTRGFDGSEALHAAPDELDATTDELPSVRIEDLDDLFAAADALRLELDLEPDFGGPATEAFGAALDPSGSSALVDSPRLHYGPIGQVVHPGPVFSAQDEALGRGVAGRPVPGLAAWLAACGRFGVYGSFLGGGAPDGTILRLLHVEQRSGEHLGVPWSGQIAWCEGVDLAARAARQGASIGGAALHEGYYVDIERMREQVVQWEAVRLAFSGAFEPSPRAGDDEATPTGETSGAVSSGGERFARGRGARARSDSAAVEAPRGSGVGSDPAGGEPDGVGRADEDRADGDGAAGPLVDGDPAAGEPAARDADAGHRTAARSAGPDPRVEERIRRALGQPALRILEGDLDPEDPATLRLARRDTTILLDAPDRLRLAVLRDRAAEGESLGAVTLDEFLELTAIHEEGHLCDRTRFYPIGRNWRAALGLLLEGLGRPEGVMGYLEYRAQLVALCLTSDPRLGVVQLLEAQAGGFTTVTPHGEAYRHLLVDFVRVLDELRVADPEAWPQLEGDRLLVQQLHRVDAEQMRAVALELARQERLDERPAQ